MRITERVIRNTEAVIVLVGGLAAAIFIPSDKIVPIAVGVLAVAIGGVYGIRTWRQRLDPRQYRDRRAILLEVGVVLGMAGLAALIALLVELSD